MLYPPKLYAKAGLLSNMDTNTLWQIVLADLEVQVGKPLFKTFLAPTKLLKLTDKEAIIGCNQPMLINLIEKRFYELIKKTIDTYTKTDVSLSFAYAPGEKKGMDDKGPLFSAVKVQALPINNTLVKFNPNYTFENFAVSSSNQMAYAAATAVARSPGKSYNPLFLYGGVGVGKTHLMQAIGYYIVNTNKETRINYCTGEEFTNNIIEAISVKTTVAFKKKYRQLNVFLIDDIQFIAGKNAVQEEFFHTFNAIYQNGGQIILTSDKPPDEISKLEARLQSRFEGGLTIDIGAPDFELRTAIILIKAKQRGVDLPIELAKLIATNTENPRKLEGVLIRILSEVEATGEPLNSEIVHRILGKTAKEAPKKNSVRNDTVAHVVANYYNIKLKELKSGQRDRAYALPRQILYYILRTELNIPLMDIGDFLGGRDHTTIMHGVKKISGLVATDKKIGEDILGIKMKLFG